MLPDRSARIGIQRHDLLFGEGLGLGVDAVAHGNHARIAAADFAGPQHGRAFGGPGVGQLRVCRTRRCNGVREDAASPDLPTPALQAAAAFADWREQAQGETGDVPCHGKANPP